MKHQEFQEDQCMSHHVLHGDHNMHAEVSHDDHDLSHQVFHGDSIMSQTESRETWNVETCMHHCFPLQEVPPPPQHARTPRRAHHLSILRQHLWPLRDGQCPHTDVAIWFHRD